MNDDERLDYIEDLSAAIVEAKMLALLCESMGDEEGAAKARHAVKQLRRTRDEQVALTSDDLFYRTSRWYREKRKRKQAKRYRKLIRKAQGG